VRQDKVKANDGSPVGRRHANERLRSPASQASRPRDSSHDDQPSRSPAVRHARNVHADDRRRRAHRRSAPLATSRHSPPPRDGSQTTCRNHRRTKTESRSSSREEVSPAPGYAADAKELAKEVKATRRQVARKKDKKKVKKTLTRLSSQSPARIPETKKKSRRQPRQNTESEDSPNDEYESSDIDESEERREAKNENVAPKAARRTISKSPKSSPKICRIQKKCGIYLQASNPKCPLLHEMYVTRILRLDQFVQPICNDCEVPLSPNGLCSICWRCEPLHLVCVQCSFAGSTEQVVF
jgi:hypothetical protein